MIDIAEQTYGIDIKKNIWFQTIAWFWFNRQDHPWTMNKIYGAMNTSKQNIHQRINRYLLQEEQRANLSKIIHQVRRDHPEMGAQSLFDLIKPDYIGRDAFRKLYTQMGFKLHQKKNYRKTTNSQGVQRFTNLILSPPGKGAHRLKLFA